MLGLACAIPSVHRAFAAEARPPETHVIVIENMKFTPATVEIRAGDHVTFKNNDLVPHTATTRPKQAASFDTGAMQPGGSFTVSPLAKEPIHYACTFHPTMEGVIVVRQ